ncbi:MAG: hypothetical protein ACTSUX_12685 [Promethearchaeota archaeon]
MADFHSKGFFGQKTALILISPSKTIPYIFIHCIKKKFNGTWEKLSFNEGKKIKFSLEEIVMILKVLNKEKFNWENTHSYNDVNTKISFRWEYENANRLWIHIGNYMKALDEAQIDIMKILLTHLLNEKIIHATSSSKPSILGDADYLELRNFNFLFKTDANAITKTQNKDFILSSTKKIEGSIKKITEKAILLENNSGNKLWIPKSVILSKYELKQDIKQNFFIDKKFLEKNGYLELIK